MSVNENTRNPKYPRRGIQAELDGQPFFMDYNPLRAELSFHLPADFTAGMHLLEIPIADFSGNAQQYTFKLKIAG